MTGQKEAQVQQEVTPAQAAPIVAPKKKSKVGIIILIILLVICAVVSALGYMAFQKAKDAANNLKNEIEQGVDSFNEAGEEFERIQQEIRDVTEQGMNGELTDEEVQKKLEELNLESLDLLKDSN